MAAWRSPSPAVCVCLFSVSGRLCLSTCPSTPASVCLSLFYLSVCLPLSLSLLVYLSVSPRVSLSGSPSVSLRVTLSLCFFCLCVCVCLALCLSLCLSVSPSACPSVSLPASLSVSLSVSPSLCLFACLYVSLSLCQTPSYFKRPHQPGKPPPAFGRRHGTQAAAPRVAA